MMDEEIAVPEQQIHCSICNIWTNTHQIMQTHLTGKRHKQRLEKMASEADLTSRSIYIFGYPINRLSRADIDDFFTKNYSKVISLSTNEPKSTWAIIEFGDKKIVDRILASKVLEIRGQKVRVKARKLKDHLKLKSDLISSTSLSNDEQGFLQVPRPDSRASTKSNSTCYSVLSDVDNCLNNNELVQLLKRRVDDFEKLRFLHENCRITETDLKRRLEICENISTFLRKYFKSKVEVILYGSSLNGFGYKDSDVDMSFELDDCELESHCRPIGMILSANLNDLIDTGAIDSVEFKTYSTSDQYQIIRKILLLHMNITDLNIISGNRCPLLKFTYISSQEKAKYCCEFTLSNKFGVNNSRYLRFLVENFPNLALFGSLLRFLAHKFSLVDRSVHSMNNYTLILMFITYLQTLGLIPIVETEFRDHAKFIGDWDCSWNNNFDHASYNNDSINFPVFTEFLRFLTKIRWTNFVFCPHFGEILPVDEFLKRRFDSSGHRRPSTPDMNNNRPTEYSIFPLNNQAKTRTLNIFRFSILNVQDPFVLAHNLAAKINPTLIKRFMKVCSILCLKIDSEFFFFDCLSENEANLAKIVDKNEETIPRYRKSQIISNFHLNIQPNQEDFNTFLEKWRFDFREKFQSSVFDNVKIMINRLLLIDLQKLGSNHENGHDEKCEIDTSPKRFKYEDSEVGVLEMRNRSETFRCTAYAPTWTNRKVQLYENVQSFVNIPENLKIRREIEISRLITESYSQKPFSEDNTPDDYNDAKKPIMIFDLFMESYATTDNDDYGVKISFESLSKEDEKSMNNMFKIFCLFFQCYYRKWRCYLATGEESV